MKVCHVTSGHANTDPRIFQKQCVSLAKAGYDVTLVAPGTGEKEECGVRVIGAGEKPVSRLKRMFRFSAQVAEKAAAQCADVYHLHDPELLRYVARLCKTGALVVFDSHEDVIEDIAEKPYIPRVFRGLVSRIYAVFFRRTSKKLAGLVSVTPHLQKKLEPYCKNTVMITNYPILTNLPDRTIKTPGAPFMVCFTGNLSPVWNLVAATQAVEALDHAQLRLCGRPDEATLSQLRSRPSWNSKVQYLGQLSLAQAQQEQKAADVGLALSSYCLNSGWKTGTLGNTKIFEYMAMGLPVICTDFDLWTGFVEKYHCGICVKPDDVQAITAALRELQKHPEEALEMGKNGQRAVLEEFNWASQEPVLLAFYQKLEQLRAV